MSGIRYVHTNIVARDWRLLVRFYCEVFDCVLVPPERSLSGDWLSKGTGVADARLEGAHLRLPGHGDSGPTLEIFSYADGIDAPAVTANRRGFGHIAFAVEDVPAMVAKVEAAGGRSVGQVVQHAVSEAGHLSFVYMADPEGNLVELQRWD